jgi:Right handed beta helix region
LWIVKLRKFHQALSLKCMVGGAAVVLLFAASASPETLTSSGPIAIAGANGTVISRMRITSTSGSCVTISNSSNVTIEKSEIGPCGDPDDGKTPANGISISGGGDIRISDNYIHVDNQAAACCDTHDNVLIRGSSNVIIQGNVIAYGETNVEVDDAPSDHISVIGNFLLNPRGPFPRGQNFQSWGAASWGPNRSIVVSDNYALSSQNSDAYRYRENQEDSINFGYTTGAVAKGNYVSGGHSRSGCGIIADDHASGMQFLNNILSDTGQCGIGIANGTSQTVSGNKILNLTPVAGAGNTALYVWNLYKTAPCGPVVLADNIGDEVQSDGVSRSGFWNGGGCGSVTLTNNVWNQPAHEQLYPMSATNPPPAIPVRPKNCVAVSPYTTNKSLPSCDSPTAASSTSPSP